MRRTASEVLNDLESRVARLERKASPAPSTHGVPATCPVCGAKTFEDLAAAGIQYVGLQAHIDPKTNTYCAAKGYYANELTSSQIATAKAYNVKAREIVDQGRTLVAIVKKSGLKARKATKGYDQLLSRKVYPTIDSVLSEIRYYRASFDGTYLTINDMKFVVEIEKTRIRILADDYNPHFKGYEKIISPVNAHPLHRLVL